MMNARHTIARLHLSQLMCRRILSSIVMGQPLETSIVFHEVAVWQEVTPRWCGIFAGHRSPERMAPATRVSRVSDQPLSPAGTSARSGSKARRTSDTPLTTAGLDLATRLRTLERTVKSRVDRREALVDILRAVNTTLEPPRIAEQIVERAATWVPAPCWAIVSQDISGELSVLAERGLEPDMGPAVYKIAAWVTQRGQEFVSGDVRRDAR